MEQQQQQQVQAEVDEELSQCYFTQFVCLFCPHVSVASREACEQHMREVHHADLSRTSPILAPLDVYGRVRLVNYVRRRVQENLPVESILFALRVPAVFASEEYLQPVLPNDALLTAMLDDDEDDDDEEDSEDEEDDDGDDDDEEDEDDDDDDDDSHHAVNSSASVFVGRTTRERMFMPRKAKAASSTSSSSAPSATPTIASLQRENERLRDQVAQLREAMHSMTQTIHRLAFTSGSSSSANAQQQPANANATANANDDDDDDLPAMVSTTPAQTAPSASPETYKESQILQRAREEEVGYFLGYSTRHIHEIMLKDTVRTLAYRDFVYKNKHVFEGKVVLDVGCGTGILSMFCAKAGASRVIGVDAADIADQARTIVEKNGYSGVVTIVKGKMEEVVLPVEHVDVIISEWMGYFLLFESMLPSVLYARDRYLRRPSSGAATTGVYPDLACMYIAGMESSEFQRDKIEYWKDVYGFDMSVLIDDRDRFMGSSVEIVKSDAIITDAAVIKSFDCNTVTTSELEFESAFTVRATRDDSLDAFCVYFTNTFSASCTHPVLLSTSPHETPTHWMQTVFRVQQRIALVCDDQVRGSITAKRIVGQPRSYHVTIAYAQYRSEELVGERFVQEFTVE